MFEDMLESAREFKAQMKSLPLSYEDLERLKYQTFNVYSAGNATLGETAITISMLNELMNEMEN